MNIGKAFTYAFEDQQWIKKLLIGAVIWIVPILNFAWFGYLVETMRNVGAGIEPPLPEWSDNFGDKFVKGLVLWLANLVYAIPMLIPLCLWMLSFPALMSAAQSGNAEEAISALTGGIGFVVICCVSIYGLILSFITPAIHIQFSHKGSFGSCFQLREIFALVSQNIGNYLTAWLVWLGGSILIGIVISILATVLGLIPCLGWILAMLISGLGSAYILVFYSHLFGQISSQSPQVVQA
jgi:hypothetical protein